MWLENCLKMQTSRDLWSLQHTLRRKQSSQHQVKLVLFALPNPIERAPSLCLRHRCRILIHGTPKWINRQQFWLCWNSVKIAKFSFYLLRRLHRFVSETTPEGKYIILSNLCLNTQKSQVGTYHWYHSRSMSAPRARLRMTLRILPYPMSSESPAPDLIIKPTSLFCPTPAQRNHDWFKTTVLVMSLMSKFNVTSLSTSHFNG